MADKKVKKQQCNHTIGYIESNGYDGAIITEFVHLDSLYLETANELKSTKGSLFNFCSNCGKKLEGLLDKKVEMFTEERNKRKEEERIKKEQAEVLFQVKVAELAIKTKLNQLPEEGSFVVIFYPNQNSNGRDFILTGTKDSILRNCVRYESSLTVKTIYKVFTLEKFESILVNNGWQSNGSKTFEKQESNKLKQISFDSSGIFYVTEKVTSSEGDISTEYDRFAINRLAEYLGVDIVLESIHLV